MRLAAFVGAIGVAIDGDRGARRPTIMNTGVRYGECPLRGVG